MSSILIKGMEMPETCWECIDQCRLVHAAKCTIYDKLYRYRHRLMNINDPILREKRAEGCPLVEVHAPHGDLIDADKVLSEIREIVKADSERGKITFAVDVFRPIKNAPTIIEAEE